MDNNDKWCATLSYLFFGLVWFLLDSSVRKNSFVKFHVHQAFLLWIIAVFLQLVTLFFVSFFFLWIFVALALFVFALLGILMALEGREDFVFSLPR